VCVYIYTYIYIYIYIYIYAYIHTHTHTHTHTYTGFDGRDKLATPIDARPSSFQVLLSGWATRTHRPGGVNPNKVRVKDRAATILWRSSPSFRLGVGVGLVEGWTAATRLGIELLGFCALTRGLCRSRRPPAKHHHHRHGHARRLLLPRCSLQVTVKRKLVDFVTCRCLFVFSRRVLSYFRFNSSKSLDTIRSFLSRQFGLTRRLG